MAMSKLYENVMAQAKGSAGDETLSCYHLLYGYIKVATLNEAVLKAVYEEESDREELDRINEILKKSELDLKLAKTALPLMWSSRVLPRAEAPAGADRSPSELLKEVLDRDLPEMEILRQGSSLDDVLRYIEERRPEHEKTPEREKTRPKKEKAEPAPEEKTEPVSEEEKDPAGQDQNTFSQLISRIREMNLVLQEKVFGQEDAINAFMEGFFQSEFLREGESRKRVPAFLYAGPPGVGKTFLALESAKLLKRPYKKIDMAEYTSSSSVQTFRGVPKTYSGPKPGEVTGFVKENPNAVLIFDEIEKSHPDVIHLFLQILDGGTLTDGFTEETVSFQDALLIFTTNVGKALYEEERDRNLSSLPARVVINALKEETGPYTDEPIFPASLCSRFAMGNVVMFNHLTINHLIQITETNFDEAARSLKTAYGYDLDYDDKLPIVFLFSLGSEMDARTVSARAGQMICREIYELGRHVSDAEDLAGLKRIRFQINLDDEAKEVQELMTMDERPRVLIAAEEDRWKDIPLESGCTLEFAGSSGEALEKLQDKDYSFVLADPCYQPDAEGNTWLSLDDYRSEGNRIINEVNYQFPDVPMYLLEEKLIDSEDKQVFLQRGIRGFLDASDAVELADSIMGLTRTLYLQRRAKELSGRGRVLTWNTAQKISEDGTEATICLYDFRVIMAVEAEDRGALLDETERPTEKFDDVIGAEDAKSELKEFIGYMKNPRKYVSSGGTPPKGVLLYGPPGTGKTMLARAMAGESDVTFIPTSASTFSNKWFGESEKNVRNLFRRARSYAPSIIFIDEIDAIGKERTGSDQTHHTENILNALLTEMDGFKVDLSRPVFVLAATNYDLDGSKSGRVLDEALARRFDNRIYVDLPKREERELYIQRYFEGMDHQVSEEAMANLARRSTGQSLAIMKGILDFAGRNARKAGSVVNDEILLNALEEYMYGEKKEWTEDYYNSVAVHEAGHAYISCLSGEKPDFVTIVSRGNFGGYMQHSDEDTPSFSRGDILKKIRVCLAGRAAEICWFGEEKGVNTGISSDLRSATEYAMGMICHYGMGDRSLVSLSPEEMLRSEAGRDLLEEVNDLLKEEMEKTIALVEGGREKIGRLVDLLIKDNQVMGGDIDRLFSEEE